MYLTRNTAEAVRLLPDDELRSLIQSVSNAISNHTATIQDYELYITAVLEEQQRDVPHVEATSR
jgi:hypothetical protein